MHPVLNEPFYKEILDALASAGRGDLASKLTDALTASDALTSAEAAEILGVSSPNTMKNWLRSGTFPGAFQTQGGRWRFLRSEVEQMRARMEELRQKNTAGDLTPPDLDDVEPLLL